MISITPGQRPTKAGVAAQVIRSIVQRSWPFDSRHFEALYRAGPDPWHVTVKPNEQRKYAATLALLPEGGSYEAMEVGCSEGAFTLLLAPRCKSLFALDVSTTALERASGRNGENRHVTYLCADVRRLHGEAQFDLITIMEVLYYLPGSEAVEEARRAAIQLLRPGGYLLLTHLQGWGDYTPHARGLQKLEHGIKSCCRCLISVGLRAIGAPIMARAPKLHASFRDTPELEVIAETIDPEFQVLLLRRT